MDDLFKKINDMTDSEIEIALKDVKITEELNSMALITYYDKAECRALQIPIDEMNREYFNRLLFYAHLKNRG